MRVRIDDVGVDGRILGVDLDQRWAVRAVGEALDGVVQALSGSLELRRVSRGIMVTGSLSAVVLRGCDRCLAQVRHALGGSVELYFEAEPLEGDVNVSLLPDELDVGFVIDRELDLAAVLAEFFVLESPARLRCGDPGVRRADPGSCEVETTQEEPALERQNPFAALKDFEA